jgi:hypothetical protein
MLFSHWLHLAQRQVGLLNCEGPCGRISNVRHVAKMPPSRGLGRNRKESQLSITMNRILMVLNWEQNEPHFALSTVPKSSAGKRARK